MSSGRATDRDLNYSVVEGATNSENVYELLDKNTSNPISLYTMLDITATKTRRPERLPPGEKPGASPCCNVDITEDSNEKAKTYNAANIVPCLVALLVAFALFFLAVSVAFAFSFMQISNLRSELAMLQGDNQITGFLAPILSTGNVFDSCAAIQQFFPFQPSSGYYQIRSSNGSVITAYCDMTRSCAHITGGWMKVADLDMRDNTAQCPDNLELRTTPLRSCTTTNSSRPTCSSGKFRVDGIEYTKVCGRIQGYQVGSTDAFLYSNIHGVSRNPLIDTYYVDGVSLTHGSSPRQHIWTFASAFYQGMNIPTRVCSCSNMAISGVVPPPPLFVGNDYFCDAGAALPGGFPTTVFFSDDPLWDGAGCEPNSMCCSFNHPPWFYKQLPQATTDDIEMRVCLDDSKLNEDIAIEIVEIYVQ